MLYTNCYYFDTDLFTSSQEQQQQTKLIVTPPPPGTDFIVHREGYTHTHTTQLL